MSRYITFDYECETCGDITIEMVERADIPGHVDCSACDAPLGKYRKLTAQITRATYLDSNKRFQSVKDQRILKKAARQAKREGRMDDVAELKKEASEVRRASRTDKQVANIDKTSGK